MPRLPTDQQLGDAQVPGPARGVYGVSAGAPQAAAERAAVGQARAADQLAGVADKLIQAEMRINAQQEVVERVRALGEYERASTQELTRLQTEDDLSKPDTTNRYGTFLADNMKKALENYRGSEEGKALLAQRLEATRFALVGQAANVGTQLGRAKVKQAFGERLSKITSEVSASPARMADALKALDRELAEIADALSPEEELQFLDVGQKEIALSAVNSLVARGNARGAREIINTSPGLREMLGPEGQRALDARLMAIEGQEEAGRRAGLQKIEEFRTIMGRDPNAAERVRLAGVAGPQGEKTPAQKIADIEAAIGPMSPEQKQKALGVYVEQSGPKLTDIAGMRGEFLKQSGDFIKVRDAYNKIKATAENPSPAGDIALIFNFMKMLDPGSTVREGEFATAQTAGSVPQQVWAQYNRAVSGERLIPEIRKDFLKQSASIYKSQLDTQKVLETTYKGLATRAGFNPADVVTDLIGSDDPAGVSGPAEQPVIQYGLGGQRVGAVKK